MLAGVSMDYYARLERGHLAGASESVLEAVARAARLGRTSLLDLARNSEMTVSRAPRRPKSAAVIPRPAVMAILAGMTGIPPYVRTPADGDHCANELCQALYGGALDDERLPLNLPGTCSWTPTVAGSSLIGTRLPTTWRVHCGFRPVVTRLTGLE
jgi:hypothetical protein